MDEDIDIEEHDLMDNPAVRNIFPDLSILKKEIQYYEYGPLLQSESVTPEVDSLDSIECESSSKTFVSEIHHSVPIIENSSKQVTDSHIGKEKTHRIDPPFDSINSSPPQVRSNIKPDNVINNLEIIKFTKQIVTRSKETYKQNNYLRKRNYQSYVIDRPSTFLKGKVQNGDKLFDDEVSDQYFNRRGKFRRLCQDSYSVKQAMQRSAKIHDENTTNKRKYPWSSTKPNTILNDVIVQIPDPHIFRSKIIIGSKPNKTSTVERISRVYESDEVTVTLEDISYYLNKSQRFCTDCQILFPNGRAFTTHKNQYHLPTNKVMRNMPKQQSTNSKGSNKCDICNTTFSSKNNLHRHKRNIHNSSMSESTSSKMSVQNTGVADEAHQKTSLKSCFHCDTLFESEKLLIDHLYNVLEPKKKKTKVTNIDKKDDINNLKAKEDATNNIEINEKDDPIKETNIICENQPEEPKESEKNKKTKGKFRKKVSKQKVGKKSQISNYHKYNNRPVKRMYRCPICSHYFFSLKYCISHMSRKHKTKQASNIKIMQFDPKCKFCAFQGSSVRYYNDHVFVKHFDKLNKVVVSKPPTPENKIRGAALKVDKQAPDILIGAEIAKCKSATKSVLFKCLKCDINFLTANDAMCHTKHMELLINWKCPTCLRIFKKEDEDLHLKQHTFCDDLVALELSEYELARVLYNCPKCAIHFAENNYLEHYPRCTLETAESTYCKVCDNLVFIDNSEVHEYFHKQDNLKPIDFTVVDGDIILEDAFATSLTTSNANSNSIDSGNNISVGNKDIELLIILSYCDTCKCFVSYLGSTRKVHVEARCAHIYTYICKHCGLKITQNGIKGHKKLHKKRKDLKLQDFLFYELNDAIPICPPIPEFPQCEHCKVYFVSRVALMRHECSEDGFFTCEICILNFSEEAFTLHRAFHEYTLKPDADNPAEITGNAHYEIPSEDVVTGAITTPPDMPNVPLKYLYRCDTCLITLTTYDKVVEHCQDHYARKEEHIVFKCDICELKFEQACYNSHESLHKSKNITLNSFKILCFDFLYFVTENDKWIKHILGTLSNREIEETLSESVYKHECRIKMEVIQNGPGDLSVYKCSKCSCFIDPGLVYKHVVSASCRRRRNHPCAYCGLPFISNASRMDHEKIHEQPNIRLKSYRIILFNKEEDSPLNGMIIRYANLFVLYQCRNCNGLVNKYLFTNHKCNRHELRICSSCGLLIYEEDLSKHKALHNNLQAFQEKNIKVVLLGVKIETVSHVLNELVPSFSGVVADFTFYRCVKCALCIKDKELKHSCCHDRLVRKCSKCNLSFLKNRIHAHLMLHDQDLDFVRSNMNIILFGDTKTIMDDSLHSVKDDNGRCANVSNDVTSFVENVVKIYKCSCGLHFVDKQSAGSHKKCCNSNVRISKQNCSKCQLLFSPNDLFNHLLEHHGDRSRIYKFDIVEIPPEQEVVTSHDAPE